jgi:hypothetical protein
MKEGYLTRKIRGPSRLLSSILHPSWFMKQSWLMFRLFPEVTWSPDGYFWKTFKIKSQLYVHAEMVSKFTTCLSKSNRVIKFLLPSLKPFTNSKCCFRSRIKILVPYSFSSLPLVVSVFASLLCWSIFSSYIEYSAYGTFLYKHRRLPACMLRVEIAAVGFWTDFQKQLVIYRREETKSLILLVSSTSLQKIVKTINACTESIIFLRPKRTFISWYCPFH